jgi:DNA-3-methyladenine glycosylase II
VPSPVADTFTIVPTGPFSLAEAANFGFGQRVEPHWDGTMRLAFCVDGFAGHAGVELRQDSTGVHGVRHGDGDAALVRSQVARVLSLDHDGEAFLEVGRRDPVIARLQAAAPGLRPPLFYSPYEAAAWSIISARRPARQMAEIRRRLSEAYGASFELAGERLAAFPTPHRLLEVDSFPGLTSDKITRLHAVAQAAIEGTLEVARIQALGPDAAMAEVRSIPGIGPFYGALIVVRASGLADVVVTEPKAMAMAGHLYDMAGPPTEAQFVAMAEAWRPFRTWAIVLLRAAGGRILNRSVD